MTTSLTPLYEKDPHHSVSYENNLEVDGPRDFSLESSVQLVSNGQAVQLDFSAYVFVQEDGSDLERERESLTAEIRAFNTLMDTLTEAHTEFLANASKALDLLASIQPTG